MALIFTIDIAGSYPPSRARRMAVTALPSALPAVAAMLAGEGDNPEAIAAARGFEAMDSSALEAAVDAAIAENAQIFENFKGGDNKAAGPLVGAVMKKTQGKADGKAVTAILRERAGL